MANQSRIYEIRWHGRGGQGAVTSAQILAEAAFHDGYQGVTAAPYFGAERRGAPVTATTRFSPEPIRINSQIETPDVVVVLDETLLGATDVAAGLKTGGWLILNSPRPPQQLGLNNAFNIATADATRIARELGLLVAGVALVNTPILGAFARATGLVSLESIQRAIRTRLSAFDAEANSRAAQTTFERTTLKLAA